MSFQFHQLRTERFVQNSAVQFQLATGDDGLRQEQCVLVGILVCYLSPVVSEDWVRTPECVNDFETALNST
ncbi:MAG: hypothetical protein NXI32_14875 [bacterium]|nr:hypothetical protein [bacterium]